MELSRSIILIGMPGCGKSTVGKILAKKYQVRFIDTDSLIKAQIGTKLQDYIDTYGRDKFLDEEHRTVMELDPEAPQIIATGGSVVLNEVSMKHLTEIGTVVFLDADLPLITKRLWNVGTRGIVFADGDTDGIRGVYAEREPLYYKYSDVRVHVRGKTPEDTAELIMKSIEK